MTLVPEASLGYRINLVARVFEQSLRAAIGPHGVVPGQFPGLLALFDEDDQTQAQLCRRVRIEQPTMAATLRRMERDGLVERVPDPADRRASRIRLTARARALEPELERAARGINERALAALTAEQRAALDAALDAMGEALA